MLIDGVEFRKIPSTVSGFSFWISSDGTVKELFRNITVIPQRDAMGNATVGVAFRRTFGTHKLDSILSACWGKETKEEPVAHEPCACIKNQIKNELIRTNSIPCTAKKFDFTERYVALETPRQKRHIPITKT